MNFDSQYWFSGIFEISKSYTSWFPPRSTSFSLYSYIYNWIFRKWIQKLLNCTRAASQKIEVDLDSYLTKWLNVNWMTLFWLGIYSSCFKLSDCSSWNLGIKYLLFVCLSSANSMQCYSCCFNPEIELFVCLNLSFIDYQTKLQWLAIG